MCRRVKIITIYKQSCHSNQHLCQISKSTLSFFKHRQTRSYSFKHMMNPFVFEDHSDWFSDGLSFATTTFCISKWWYLSLGLSTTFSDDGGSEMDLVDGSSGVVGILFEENCWCLDGVEGVMSSDEDFGPERDTNSDSASLYSAESEDYEGFRYRHCEVIYFPDERSWF